MEFARRLLDSIRRQVVFTVTYVRDSVVSFVYTTDTSINDEQVHRPPFVELQDDTAFETNALKGGLTCYTIKAQDVTDPITFMESVRSKVVSQLFKPETKVFIKLECV